MRFTGTIELNGKTATGIEVPPEVVEELGAGKHPNVRVTIRDHIYRSSIASMGGRFLLGVNADVRKAAGVVAGDVVVVELEVDTAPRVVQVPPDLAEALAAEPDAKRFFEGLSYSQQRWFTLSVEDAKKPETRRRRVEKAIGMLKEGRAR
jgi:Bacteriocin-protection, YdeI or OmpD-Associated/Domain of unknown function (DUF1905)